MLIYSRRQPLIYDMSGSTSDLPTNIPLLLVQLSLTIVYIAGGVFVAGWIGKINTI